MSKTKKNDNKTAQNSEEIIEKAALETDEVLEEAAEENIEEVSDEEAEEVTGEEASEADEEATEEVDEEADEATEETADKPTKKTVVEKEDTAVSNEEFRKLPFIEKCKRDPVIPVTILLAFVAVLVASIYFILPNARTPSMGIGLSDFVHDFNNGAVALSLMDSGADIGFRTPPYIDPDSNPGMLGDKAVITASRSYADFFAGPSKYFINAGIEGATRKSDNTLAYVRIWVQYSDMSDDADFNTVWMYFSNTLNALYTNMNAYEAMGIAMNKMGEYDGDTRFYVRGDYAFRLVPVQKDGIAYIVIDVVPKSALNESQIREVLEVTPDPATIESVPDESAPVST